MAPTTRVLVVADREAPGVGAGLEAVDDLSVETVASGAAALDRLAAEPGFDCVVVGDGLETAGLSLFEAVRERRPGLPFVLAPADGSERLASDAFATGVSDYVPLDAANPAYERLVTRIEAVVDADRRDAQDREQYETIVETVPEGVFVLDEEATILAGNETGAEMLGMPYEELIGTAVPELVEQDIFESAVIDRYLEEVPKLVSSDSDREMATFEFRSFPDSPAERTLEARVALRPYEDVFRGTIGVLRDVTERKRRQAELERYGTIIDAIPDPVYAHDGEGTLQFVNEAMVEVTGYDRETLEEKGIFVGMSETDIERSMAAIRELISEGRTDDKVAFEMDLITRDGRTVPVENHFALLPFEDNYRGSAGVLRDISDRKRRKRRLDVLNTVLRHNLRNDMNLIIGDAQSIESRTSDAEVRALADDVREQAHDMVRMADEIRKIQRTLDADSSRERDHAQVDLVPLVIAAVDRVRSAFPDADVAVDLPQSAAVVGDSTLERAVHELVENAVEHADREPPTVDVSVVETVEPPTTAVRDAAVGDWVALRIADDGPGIPDYERDLVTGEDRITPLRHGSGLGLWVVAWIVEAFGGVMRIEDRDPRGTVVTLLLRRAD